MSASRIGDAALSRRLKDEIEGEVLFDAFSRGRYATDASIYQVEPIGVIVAKSDEDIVRAVEIARAAGVPVLPRGAGTSQCGQTVNEALVVDCSKHLNRVLSLDAAARTVRVEPGIVLDRLNAYLRPHGLFFPVDVSTAAQATIGGMAGNNSCGSRSIRYGNMVHNVAAIDAVLADGQRWHFGPVPEALDGLDNQPEFRDLVAALRALAAREADELEARWPKLLRRVGGYNLDMLGPRNQNMAHILVGSEGTLAFSTAIELMLQPIPPAKALGVCHFPSFYQAMQTTQHIVELGPSAVELVDRTMVELAREIPAYRRIVDRFVQGEPEALLLVEFAGEDKAEQAAALGRLEQLMGDLGFPDAVLQITDNAFQAEVWEVRKAGLNIMMSMKGDGKPVSFIEDCAVALPDLAEYTERLNGVFARHGIKGTWYAHASVGTLHVRPVINLKDPQGAKTMRAVAEEAFAMVREYKGSHSGEHGDGIVRSEFHEPMFGSRLTRAFEEVKQRFDPEGRFNPGRIVHPPKMDDRTLFRFKPGYKIDEIDTALDWSEWGGFAGAVEMCNNNGACRKATGVMCPSFRVTGNEQDLTRGRANTLRLAISGQLGREALVAEEMKATMELCVGCKGCKRECPTGVDMARMKLEFQYHHARRHGLGPRERLIGYLPRYAPWAARLAPLANLPDRWPWARRLGERLVGIAAERSLPRWRRDLFAERAELADADVLLLPDTFNSHFEPDNLRAALSVLRAGGRKVAVARAADGGRPLCCGRTFLAVGLIEEARAEARRLLRALAPYVARGLPVVGLEPSCLLTLRDELPVLLPGEETSMLATKARLFEEFVADELGDGRLPLQPLPQRRALLHGHCHQKAFGAMGAVTGALSLVPALEVETVESSCCGMAGGFGYEAEHYETSKAMAELALLPAVRVAGEDTLVVASGTSCRHQIADGTGREALHVARVLERALAR